jgi:sporulation protein YlmC with PRC-barrel domain
MRIALGQDVLARDGTKVGKVDRVVLNDKNNQVEQLVVRKDMGFMTDKLVDRAMIDRVDATGVHLTIDPTDEKELPDFSYGGFYEWAQAADMFYPEPMPGWYPGSILYANAPFDPPIVRSDGIPSEDDVSIGKDAAVVSSDDHEIGHVHEVEYDEGGNLTSLVVQAGHLHKHRFHVPAAWIAETDDFQVRLNVKADETAVVGAGAPEP